jgi:hypothetical protein
LAATLAGEPARDVESVRRGGNSRVFRVQYTARACALKLYPPRAADPRDRLGAEAAALRFLGADAGCPTPRLIAIDTGRNAALLEWIEGVPVADPADTGVDAALAFLARLHARRNEDGAAALPAASEACLSAAELESQIARRLDRLAEASAKTPTLAALLQSGLRPSLADFSGRGRAAYRAASLAWESDIPDARRTLSPSDFGFHNALRRANGEIVFLDFEYFGWDDPVKLTSDVLLHPGMNLADTAKRRFLEGARAIYDDDPSFAARLAALYPLFGLRWCAILLNEFLPEKWAVRAHAGGGDAESARTRQLAKAEALLHRLTGNDAVRDALGS